VGEVDELGANTERTAGGRFRRRPAAPSVIAYLGLRIPGCSSFPHRRRGPSTNPARGGGRRIGPQAVGGAQRHRRGGDSNWSSPRVGALQARSPRADLVGLPSEEIPGVLQDVSSCPQSHRHELFSLFCLLNLVLSSRRNADTGVLILAPLNRLALGARVVPSEPRPQPPYAEPLTAQVEEALAVATVLEELAMPPPPVDAAAIKDGRSWRRPLPKRHWGRRPGPARVVRTWWWWSRTTVRRHPRRWGNMTPQCQQRLSFNCCGRSVGRGCDGFVVVPVRGLPRHRDC
jgi:hypothetical protein